MITLKIPYDKKDWAKNIAYTNNEKLLWDPNTKNWTYTGKTLPPELSQYKVNNTINNPQKTVAQKTIVPYTKQTTTKPKLNNTAKPKWILSIPFEDSRFFQKEYNIKYDSDLKATYYEGNDLPLQLTGYQPLPFSFEWNLQKELNAELGTHINLELPPSDFTYTPRQHQIEAIKKIKDCSKKYPGFLLADDVGVGKTISAWEGVKDLGQDILVVTTLSTIPHWRRTILASNARNKNITLINYDRLQKLIEAGEQAKTAKPKKPVKRSTKNKRLAKTGTAKDYDVIIWDESHKLKNITSLRFKYARKLNENANFILWMSATAGQNPLELAYLEKLLAKITNSNIKEFAEYEKWCQSLGIGVKRGAYGKWEWNSEGTQKQKDCKLINKLLFEGITGIRRTPSDINGWPEINRIPHEIELSSDDFDRYKQAWNEFKQGTSAKKTINSKEKSKNNLVEQLRFRQKVSILKISNTLEILDDLIENNLQVAISVNFIETQEELTRKIASIYKNKIGVSIINGQQNVAIKEENRLNFQKGVNKIVIFTVEEGISLHEGEYNQAKRAMIIHDLRWSAISLAQIEGRTHRDGKLSDIYWSYTLNTIEEKIINVLVERVKSMKTMLGDDDDTLNIIEKEISKINEY